MFFPTKKGENMKNFVSKVLYLLAITLSVHAFADITSGLSTYTCFDCNLEEQESTKEDALTLEKRTHPHLAVDQGRSTNWSGYASATHLDRPANDSVKTVTGTWTVPHLRPTPDKTYTAIWVGIDGYSSGTVEQIGTEHDWNKGSQQDYAWFEMYPGPSYQITGFPLNPGDVIQAEVEYKGQNQFQLSLVNHTQKVYTIIPSKYTQSAVAKRSSAEWIVEAPYLSSVLPLSNFHHVSFTNCEAIINGKKGGIQSKYWETEALTMQTMRGVTKAFPSKLSKGRDSFRVTWRHE